MPTPEKLKTTIWKDHGLIRIMKKNTTKFSLSIGLMLQTNIFHRVDKVMTQM
jgi:hypothetical protein